jgi:sugar lactone lactonase YvrE
MREEPRSSTVVPPVALLLAWLVVAIVTAQAQGLVETVVSYDAAANELPEGIAIDRRGNIYVSLNPLGQIRKISPGGSESVLVDFGEPGPLGMTVAEPGYVYVGWASDNPEIAGVWRIGPDGASTRLPGTAGISFPNALAFDQHGNLYVTDSSAGAIWRVPPGGSAEVWLQHDLLEGLGLDEFPVPFPLGANGIVYRHDTLYVANTEKGHVVRIPIVAGDAGEPEVVASGDELVGLDGIALDAVGTIFAVVNIQNKLVRIDPTDGAITTLATADDGLDFPASLTFGRGTRDRQSVFITNLAIVPTGGAGPGVVKVDVGVAGLLAPPGKDNLTARVFLDYRCDGYFRSGIDLPLAQVPVTLGFANGATETHLTSAHGMLNVSGFDASEGVTVSADLPASYRGYALRRCFGGPTTIDVPAGGFPFGHTFVQFGAEAMGEVAGP